MVKQKTRPQLTETTETEMFRQRTQNTLIADDDIVVEQAIEQLKAMEIDALKDANINEEKLEMNILQENESIDDIEQKEQDMLFNIDAVTIGETNIIDEINDENTDDSSEVQMIKFFKPSEIDSDDSSDESDEETAGDNKPKKAKFGGLLTDDRRVNWQSSNRDNDSDDDESTLGDEIKVPTLMDIYEKLDEFEMLDLKNEEGNIYWAPIMDTMRREKARRFGIYLSTIDDHTLKDKFRATCKILTPHGYDKLREEFINTMENSIRNNDVEIKDVEKILKSYKLQLKNKSHIPKFKFNIDRKLGIDLIRANVPISDTIAIVPDNPKYGKIKMSIIDAYHDLLMQSVVKQRKTSDDLISLVEVQIGYKHGVNLTINNEQYTPPNIITSNTLNIVSRQLNIDKSLKDLIEAAKIIVFDVHNMINSMHMTKETINALSLSLNNHGLTTIAIVDNDKMTLEKATMNVIEDQFGHDDITSLIYAVTNRAVIITNDTHKEFKPVVSVCRTHNNLLTRTNEYCNVTDGKSCIIKTISSSPPRYASINNVIDKDNYLTIKFDAPMIRRRKDKKKGIVTMRISKQLNDNIKRWSIYVNTCSVLNINTVKSRDFVASYNVITFHGNNCQHLVIGNHKVKTIAYLLNTLSNDAIMAIKRGITSMIAYDDGKVLIKDVNNRAMDLSTETSAEQVRKAFIRRAMSLLFGYDYVLQRSNEKIQTMFDLPKFATKASDYSLIITKISITRSIAALFVDEKQYLVLLDSSFIDLIQNNAIKLLDNSVDNIYNDILPITNAKMSQFILYKDVSWSNDKVNKIIEITVGQGLYKQLDLTSFKSGAIYWNQYHDKDMIALNLAVTIEDIQTQQMSNINDVIMVNSTKETIEYYGSGQSGSIYKYMSDLGTTRTIYVRYTEYSNTPKLQLVQITTNDAMKLYNNTHTQIQKKIVTIVDDIMTVYRTMVTKSCLICLPPLIWSYRTDKLNILPGLKDHLIKAEYSYKDIDITVYYLIRNDHMVVVFKLKTDYKVLYPSITMRYSHSYEPIEFDHTYMDYILENGMGMMRDDMQIYTNLENYINYYMIFALPLIYAGYAPSSQLTKFKPIIVDNIVVDYVENEPAPMSEFLDDVAMEPGLWLSTTDVGFIYPMRRIIKDETDQIDINAEIHGIIDELYQEPVEQELKYPMFLMVFRLLHPWSLTILHMQQCYKLPVDEAMTVDQVSLVLINNYRFPCECCVADNFNVDTLHGIIAYPQDKSRTIDTPVTRFYVDQSLPKVTITNTQRTYMSPIMDTIPLVGHVLIVDIVKENNKWEKSRTHYLKNIMANQTGLISKIKTVISKKDGGNIATFIQNTINNALKQNKIVVLLAFNELGALIKKQKQTINISMIYDNRLYVPDVLLFTAIKAYARCHMTDIKTDGTIEKVTKKMIKKKNDNVKSPITTIGKLNTVDKEETIASKYRDKDGYQNVLIGIILIIFVFILIIATPLKVVILWPMMLANIYIGKGLLTTIIGILGIVIWMGCLSILTRQIIKWIY